MSEINLLVKMNFSPMCISSGANEGRLVGSRKMTISQVFNFIMIMKMYLLWKPLINMLKQSISDRVVLRIQIE